MNTFHYFNDMKRYPSYLMLLSLMTACAPREHAVDFKLLEKQYAQHPADSLKLQALQYLEKEMPCQLSEMPIVKDISTGRLTSIRIDSFTSAKSLLSFLKKEQLKTGQIVKKDADFIQTTYLGNTIDASIALWNRFPWNKDIPKEIFFDYLLPYKIHQDYPDNWRLPLKQKADSLIKVWEEKNRQKPGDRFLTSSKEFYYDLIVNTASGWFKYGEDEIRITEDPSYRELVLVGEGGCKKGSFFNAYVLRSAGIPATVDIVPFWGSKNGSHAGDVYWNNEERKMMPGPGRQFHRAAKVFRLTFRNHGSWSQQIKPYVNESDFLLDFLRNDQWLDVTQEHNPTSDITMPVVTNAIPGTAYICVYDYGEWVPLFWAPVSNNAATFRQMGRDIVYRIATFEGELKFNGDIFLLDSAGQVKSPYPDPLKKQTMTLQKLNSGSEQWVSKNQSYTLLLLEKDNTWHKVAEQTCTKDSTIEFREVPSQGLYRLVKTDGPQQLERFFAYKNRQQIWY